MAQSTNSLQIFVTPSFLRNTAPSSEISMTKIVSLLSLKKAVNATSQALLGQLPVLPWLLRVKPVDNRLLCWVHLQKFTLVFITEHLHSAPFQSCLTYMQEVAVIFLVNCIS